MDWYTGLLAVLAGVEILLSSLEIREQRQQQERQSLLKHLDSVVGHG